MLLSSSLQIPPLENWQDFQNLCCDLWKKIWNDPQTQMNGRQGQEQNGVDIFGKPDQKESWVGIQCKGKDNYKERKLTKKEINSEVKKAKSFRPKLSQFIFATTGFRDAKIQELARLITDKNNKNGLFSVTVYFWEDIKEFLDDFPDVKNKYYSELGASTTTIKDGVDELKKGTNSILMNTTGIQSSISTLADKIDTLTTNAPRVINPHELTDSILITEHQAEIDYSKDLLNNYKPQEALNYLEKLRKRILSSASAKVKYRILTNIGSAKLHLNKENEAAELFIEALQYNPEDEKALCNVALGYLILSQGKQAQEYANKVLAKNPMNTLAYSIILQVLSKEESLENIIAIVPEHLKRSSEVAYAIGYIARKKEMLTDSIKWLDIAVTNDKEDLPDLKGSLGERILESILKDQSIFLSDQLKDIQKQSLLKIIDLLTAAWKKVENTELKSYRLYWLVNRGLAKRILKDTKSAIQDIDYALNLESQNSTFIKYRALLAYEDGDYEKAENLFESISSLKENPEVLLLLAEVLRKKEKYQKALDKINELLKRDITSSLREEVNSFLIKLHFVMGNIEAARNLSNQIIASDPTNIFNLVDAARLANLLGRRDECLSFLKDAKENITDKSSFRELFLLGQEYYSLELFEEASRIFEKIADDKTNSNITLNLLNSYYRSGQTDLALKLCQSLHKNCGPLSFVSEMESAIYEEIGDLPKAYKVCKEYLTASQNDIGMQIRLAVVNLRSRNYSELDEYLNSSIDIQSVSLPQGILLASLFAIRNILDKSLALMYELRRKYYNEANAHLKYVGIISLYVKDDRWINLSKIEVNTAACIMDELDQLKWFIIEDRSDADILRKEININHPLAKQLLGKAIGDKVLLKDTPFAKEEGTIKEIKHKYVYALHDSLSVFEEMFPESNGLWAMRTKESDKNGNQKLVAKIKDDLNEYQIRIHKIEKYYLDNKLTIGAFAEFVGRNVLDVWAGIIANPNMGIKCCNGDDEERSYALSQLGRRNLKLVIDIISLITIHSIKAQDLVVKVYGKLGIAQSTIDLIETILNEKRTQLPGIISISKEGDNYIRQNITIEDLTRNIKFLDNLINWIKNNCEVLPCREALQMNKFKREQLIEIMGKSFFDTIIIASQPGNMLFSDDERLRSLAKNEWNVDGVWTQILLIGFLKAKHMDMTAYNDLTIKLALLNYKHTSINAYVLMEAAKQSDWRPDVPFKMVVRILSGMSSDENSALIVSTDFLYELYKETLAPIQKDNLALSLINAITYGRKGNVILDKLIRNIQVKLFLLPLAQISIIKLINAWKKTHIV